MVHQTCTRNAELTVELTHPKMLLQCSNEMPTKTAQVAFLGKDKQFSGTGQRENEYSIKHQLKTKSTAQRENKAKKVPVLTDVEKNDGPAKKSDGLLR